MNCVTSMQPEKHIVHQSQSPDNAMPMRSISLSSRSIDECLLWAVLAFKIPDSGLVSFSALVVTQRPLSTLLLSS
jgi:hypothetical protein